MTTLIHNLDRKAPATVEPTEQTVPSEGVQKRTLLGAIRSEAKRLTRKSFTGVGLALVVFFSLMGAVVTFFAGDGGMGGAVAVDLESAQGIVAALSMAGNLIGIVALSLWAAAVASDYSTGWVRLMVAAEPRRWRLLFGKLVALSGFTVIATIVATAIAVAMAYLLAGPAGVSTAAWSVGVFGTVLSGWLNFTLSVLGWGVIGFTVAVMSRSAIVAIAGGIGYMMVFEGLLGMLAESATTYLPGTVLNAVAAGGTAVMAYGTALLLATGFVLAALVIAFAVFARRDITA